MDKEVVRQALGGIENVLRHYHIEILPGGKVRCIFHGEDRNASASIARGFFHCFGCGLSLGEIPFIMKMEGCDFLTALSIAAQMAGLPVHDSPQAKRQLATTLKRRKHDKGEAHRVSMSAEDKYRLLASLARRYRPQSPQWLPLLDYLLDVWLKSVPPDVDVRPLFLSQNSVTEAGICIQRLFREWRLAHDELQ